MEKVWGQRATGSARKKSKSSICSIKTRQKNTAEWEINDAKRHTTENTREVISCSALEWMKGAGKE